jgi:predicted tellurium resistance membrane protein TerC
MPFAVLELDVTAPMWALLAAIVVVMLAVDLVVFARGRAPTLRESAVWSVVWLAVALLFGAGFWAWQGHDAGVQFLSGYLLERTLSLDNVFVFAVLLGYFAVPLREQSTVLSWGIALALLLRLVFILIGAALLDAFHLTFYGFGALLLYTAWKLARHEGAQVDPEHNRVLQLVRRRLGMKPMVAVFVAIALTDVLFAVDSIPAIFAITREPFIVFAANAFALLGLRALYFVLAGMLDRFAYLSHGLAAILAFIGSKMLLVDVWHPPIWVSLAVIVGVLAAAALASVVAPPRARSAT